MIGSWFSSPLFRVVGQEAPLLSGLRTPACRNFSFFNPEFRLAPTRQYYATVTFGLAVTAAPFLARTLLLGLAISLIFLLCTARLLINLWKIGGFRLEFRDQISLIPANQLLQDKRRSAIWLIFTVPIGVITSAISFLGIANLPSQSSLYTIDAGIIFPLAAGLVIYLAIVRLWTMHSPSFRLPTLEGRYRSVSQTVQEKITYSTERVVVASAQTWRVSSNISTEIHLAGHAEALFGSDSEGAVWKRSIRALIWYYAPVSLPFLVLLTLPTLTLASQVFLGLPVPFSFRVAERHELALATIIWATWSMSHFIISSERDFFGNQSLDNSGRTRTDADLYQLVSLKDRDVLRGSMADRGQFVLQILVLAAAPSLLGYFQMFPETVKLGGKTEITCVANSTFLFVEETMTVTAQPCGFDKTLRRAPRKTSCGAMENNLSAYTAIPEASTNENQRTLTGQTYVRRKGQ